MQSNSVRALTLWTLALLAVFGVTACGDSTDLVLSELSEAEAAELAGALVFAAFEGTGSVQPPSSAQAVPYEYTETVSGTVPCPLRGLVAYSATVTATGDTEQPGGSVTYSMTQEHDDCAVATENETVFVINGAPSLTLTFNVTDTGTGVVEWGGSLHGAISWVTGNRTGTCEAHFEFSGRQEGETVVVGGLGGTMCGHSVQQEFTVG